MDDDTNDAIDDLLSDTEGLRIRDPALGRVVRIEHNDFDDSALAYALYDATTGRRLRREDGTFWVTNDVDEIRTFLRDESGKQPPIDSLILDRFFGEDLEAFQTSLKLSDMKMFKSKAFHATGAKLIDISEVRQEAVGIYSARATFESQRQSVRLTFRSTFKEAVVKAVDTVKSLFGGGKAKSVEAAVQRARKVAIQAGFDPKALAVEYTEEAGGTQVVVEPSVDTGRQPHFLCNWRGKVLLVSRWLH